MRVVQQVHEETRRQQQQVRTALTEHREAVGVLQAEVEAGQQPWASEPAEGNCSAPIPLCHSS